MGKIKVCSLTPFMTPGAVSKNTQEVISAVAMAQKEGAEVAVLPKNCFSAEIGELRFRQDVANQVLKSAEQAIKQTEICVVLGISYLSAQIALVCAGGEFVAAARLEGSKADFEAATKRLGISHLPDQYAYKNFLIKPIQEGVLNICGPNFLADSGKVYSAFKQDLQGYEGIILAIPASYAASLGGQEKKLAECAAVSYKNKCCVIISCTGAGESVQDYVRSGDKIISVFGSILAYKDFDSDFAQADFDTKLQLELPKLPDYLPRFLPKESECQQIFDILSRGIIGRRRESRTSKIIFGLSGGLDSTMTLLCALNAEKYGLDKKDIICVAMPSRVSSKRTKDNAFRLIEGCGVSGIEVPIAQGVELQLKDINHQEKDVVYENVQARHRAQILFNLANKYSGLVLGTSDLSESALGWCTYGGDGLAHYNPNSSLTKNAIRTLVRWAAKSNLVPKGINKTLLDVLDTPISPELLDNQHTEQIIGKYCLHEFFLLRFLAYRQSAQEIIEAAQKQFLEFDNNYIKKTYEIFIKRFLSSRFKTNATCDGIMLTPYDFALKEFGSGVSAEVFNL